MLKLVIDIKWIVLVPWVRRESSLASCDLQGCPAHQ